MWSEDLLMAHAESVICARNETQLYREPVLYVIDSYGCHVKLADSKRLERYKIFVLLVPLNLTNLLQPLDVAINRSYQEFYRSKYGDYIDTALRDPSLQSKAGNPKMSHYAKMAQWTLDWVVTKSGDSVKKAFTLCGLVAKATFKMDELYAPLKAILKPDLDMSELEIFEAATMHGWNITLKTVDAEGRLESSFTYAAENAAKDVCLGRSGGFFAVKVDGYLL
uniref:DDE-1 domain-containing protein n=1 Tax=Phytophthora ramorum TaxID=164328 RepID=H3H4H5_PHYRM